MAESCSGIGIMLGPVIGSFLYTSFGYFWAFMCFAIYISIASILSFYILPNSLNSEKEEN
jgi:MFS family permease